MRKLILLFTMLFPLLSAITFAQENMYTTIYLKNGSVVRGGIIENIPDSIVKLKTNDGNLWVFEYSEIMKFEETTIDKKQLYNRNSYIFSLENSVSVSVEDRSSNPEKATAVFIGSGFKYSNGFYTGIVAGVEKWDITTIPLLIEQHISIYKRNASPFVYFRGGYSFAVNDKDNKDAIYIENKWYGGFTYDIGIGVKVHISKFFGMYFSLGYRQQNLLQKFKENTNIYYWDIRGEPYRIERQYVYNRFALKIGMFF